MEFSHCCSGMNYHCPLLSWLQASWSPFEFQRLYAYEERRGKGEGMHLGGRAGTVPLFWGVIKAGSFREVLRGISIKYSSVLYFCAKIRFISLTLSVLGCGMNSILIWFTERTKSIVLGFFRGMPEIPLAYISDDWIVSSLLLVEF